MAREREYLLNGGHPAWWFVRDVARAHLVVEVLGAAPLNRAVVVTRCGDRWKQGRLERPWDAEWNREGQKCQSCSQKGAIR